MKLSDARDQNPRKTVSINYNEYQFDKTNLQLKKKRHFLKKPIKLNFTKFSFQCTSLDSTLNTTFCQNGGKTLVGRLNMQQNNFTRQVFLEMFWKLVMPLEFKGLRLQGEDN